MEEQEEKVIIVVIQKLFRPYVRVDLWTHKFANFLNFAYINFVNYSLLCEGCF